MHIVIRTIIPIAVASLMLGGCISTGNKSAVTDETNMAQGSGYTAKPGLAEKKRLSLVLKYLEQGEPAKARVELLEYMEASHDVKKAQRLLAQIDTPVDKYYPQEHFQVKLKKGESLSTLARDYLGDVFSFYALAKYNNIEKPSKIDAGQIIKIPTTKQSLKHKADLIASAKESAGKAPEDVVTDSDLWSVVNKAADKRDYAAAAAGLDKLEAEGELSATEKSQSITIYNNAAKSLESSDPKRASAYYFESAKAQIGSGDREGAISVLKKVLQLDGSNSEANNLLQPLKQEFADKYHREASIYYRKQQLNKAIELWGKALEIDPDHSAADAYLVRAKELKKRFDKLR